MITEDYVSFELAKLLKEKGFDEEIETLITPEGKIYYVDQNSVSRACHTKIKNSDINIYSEDCSCPTLQMVMKWLREVHHLVVSVEYQVICPTFKWRIYDMNSSDNKYTDFKHYDTYEEACKQGIQYCLALLIVK